MILNPLVPIIQSTTAVGAQADFALTPGCTLLRCNNAALLSISGFSAGYDGQRLTVVSIGAGIVEFLPQSALSALANRLINFVTVGNTPLAAGFGVAVFVYDLTTARWRLESHEQGAWITPAYAAGDYTGGWTVDAGDVAVLKYILRGRSLTVAFSLFTVTMTATVFQSRIIPGGFSAASAIRNMTWLTNSGVNGSGIVIVNNSAATKLDFYANLDLTTNWGVGANTSAVAGEIIFEVT